MGRFMRLLFAAFVTLGMHMEANSKDFWWPYLASYDKGPGSIRVNLGLRKLIPFADYSHLVVTGTTYETKREDGLPEAADIDRLNALSEKVIAAVKGTSDAVYVGTFTHDREQLHYVYVKHTRNLEGNLASMYLSACKGCKSYINIKHDPAWSAYTDFLYPNKMTLKHYSAELKRLGFDAQ